MTLVPFDGQFLTKLGPGQAVITSNAPNLINNTTLDAALEMLVSYGQVITADGGSHTIDTTGSSALIWRTAGVTFSNGGTVVNVGLADLDTGAGPPGRAVNVADAVTFDVRAAFTGGGGGITASAEQISVPTTGTKTIANGDFVAFVVQMTTRGGADTVVATSNTEGRQAQLPGVTQFVAGAYASVSAAPNCYIVFSDGTLGWFYGSEYVGVAITRTFNSSSPNVEYGQQFAFPWPLRIFGLYAWVDPDANFDMVLYSDPAGTPVAERTVSVDANIVQIAQGRPIFLLFDTPYDTTADQPIAVIAKPGASNITLYGSTLSNAAHRIMFAGGTNSMGVARASGAFAAENSNLDIYYTGLLVSGFDDGAGAGGGVTPLGNGLHPIGTGVGA